VSVVTTVVLIWVTAVAIRSQQTRQPPVDRAPMRQSEEETAANERREPDEWQPSAYYDADDVVRHAGVSWVATARSVNRKPGAGPEIGVPQGFGGNARGAAGGAEYWVTTLEDSGPGSLRDGAERAGPLWIRFQVSGEIRLREDIMVASDKTIDGRGASVTITRKGLRLHGVSNVILENLRFRNGRGDTTDAIQIANGSHDVWVDHCDLGGYPDGLVDITGGATDVTVSWSAFSHITPPDNNGKTMLINGEAADGESATARPRVTLHHNYFDATIQRNPKLRHGLVHAYNNYLRKWGSYGMAAEDGGELYSEANIFEAGDSKRALSTSPVGSGGTEGYARSLNNFLLNDASAPSNRPNDVFDLSDYYSVEVESADLTLRDRIVAGAGQQDTSADVWVRAAG
jgi:pectate lyase